MAYRVLARAYRSNTFDEVVGQGPVATTLKNAIASGRVHHGYLFTGTRGVGKTSMARILAKALNCLSHDAPTATPCCTCDSCRAIAIGEDVDVVEIDAASNSGVENIRELRGNAALRPARARFKIYIVDEVHMLSKEAFNALLKTLEEPPSHVKFILATTEAQKIPATIQSRCQRFEFNAIDATMIAEHLTHVLKCEKVEADEAVVRRIARLATGSMRDALSLLDKLLSYDAERLTAQVADEVIPPPHDELAFAVMQSVAEQDAAGTLRALDRALQTGRTVERFCDHLVEHARTLMLLRVCGAETDLVDVSGPMRPTLAEQAAKFDAPTYVYMITLLEELRRNVKFSGAARALADAAVVRLSMSRQFTDINELLERLESGDGAAPASALGASAGSKKKEFDSSALKSRPSAGAVAPVKATSPRAEVEARDAGCDDPPLPRASEPAPMVQAGLSTPPPGGHLAGSTLWSRAVRDPLVQRVKDAVEGTLLDVRPAKDAATVADEAPAVTDEITDEMEPESAESDQLFAGLE